MCAQHKSRSAGLVRAVTLLAAVAILAARAEVVRMSRGKKSDILPPYADLGALVLSSIDLGNGNNQDWCYFGNITIPGATAADDQIFSVIYDTGSNILWVPVEGCSCQGVADFFNPALAANYYESSVIESIQYGSGAVSGYVGTTNVSVGAGTVNVAMDNILFAREVQMQAPETPLFSGIMGLGVDQDTQNVFDVAAQQGQIASAVFAFEIKTAPEASLFYYGDIPDAITSNVLTANVVSPTYWCFQVTQVDVARDAVKSMHKYSALVDSGTSLILLPSSLYQLIVSQLSAYYLALTKQQLDVNLIACKNAQFLPNITFYAHALRVSIAPESYLLPLSTNTPPTFCYVGIDQFTTFAGGPDIILGDSFMRSTIVVYDKQKKSIGFQGSSVFSNTQFEEFLVTTAYSLVFMGVSLIISIYAYWKVHLQRKHLKRVYTPNPQYVLYK